MKWELYSLKRQIYQRFWEECRLEVGCLNKLPQFRSIDKYSSPKKKNQDKSLADNPFSASCDSIVASLSSPRKLMKEKKTASPKKNPNEVNMVFNLAGKTFSRVWNFKDQPDSPTKSIRFNLPKKDSFDFDISSSESFTEDGKVNY